MFFSASGRIDCLRRATVFVLTLLLMLAAQAGTIGEPADDVNRPEDVSGLFAARYDFGVAPLDSADSSFVWHTFYGSSLRDRAYAIAHDAQSNVYPEKCTNLGKLAHFVEIS